MKNAEVEARNGLRFHYRIIVQDREIPDAGLITTYGMLATDEMGNEVCIADISTCRRTVEELAALFDREQVSLVHIREILEDFWGIDV